MRFRWLCVLVAIAGCEDASPLELQTPWSDASAPPTASAPSPFTGADAGPIAQAGPGTQSSTSASGTNPATNPGATPTGSATAGGLPCAVDEVLKTKCQTCHGKPLMSGPMPLITHADLLAASTVQTGSKIAERVRLRIHETAKPMPPASRPALTPAELKTLDDYLGAGAPESRETCTAQPAAQGSEKLGSWQPPDSDCEVMLELRAHGAQTPEDTTPFEAPTGGDHYELFYFKPTWTQKMHVIRLDPIVDNGAVLHHWLLYMQDGNGGGIGTHQSDSGLQSADSQLLSGWAPGNKSLPLGNEVGMQVIQGPNARFALEVHYNTDANPPNRMDRSGVRLCATSKLRPREAGTHWLGTQVIANVLPLGGIYDAVGTCSATQESHIIAYSPHLHRYGKAQKSIVQHPDGSSETLNDGPFAFTDQQIFPVTNAAGEVVIKPGDVITTTCSYDGSSFFTFGPGTSDEMCYNFVVAWPAGSLSNGSPGLVGGKNTCIDGL